MKKNSTTNQSTEEQKKEELKDEIRSYLNKYENIKNSKNFTYRQKDILSLMLFRGNGQDEGFTMGYKHIMDIFGYSRSTISATIGMLKDYNFISVEKGHTGVNSKYTLNYDAMKSFKSSSTEFDSEIEQDKTSKNRQDKQKQTRQDKTSKRTNKVTDNQIDTQVLSNKSDKLDIIIELLKQNLNINNNININLNYIRNIISNNNNTEGNNTRDQEKKKNISTVNLEILKENSKDENSNDEIIPSGMKDSSEDNDNISKVKSSNNENPDNENNIPSESRIPSDEGNISDNENPSDYPPLDVDGFFEDSNSTEYRNNENLNEENETSMDENSKANGSSKEDGGLSEDKNPSDENPSKTNENPEDDEMDCSVFGDSNSTDEDKDKDNDKWYESSRSAKSDNHENGMFTNLISELTSNENPEDNEISNDNNSKTSENMKKTNNKTNTIPSEVKNPSDENPKANENLNAFGKLQSFRDLKTGRIDGYQFNSYDNLNDSRDYSKSFHASVLCLNLEPSELKASVSDTGTWGMLSRKDGVYSFIPSNVVPSYAPNNTPQASKTSEVDNHTAEGEKVAPVQSPIANKASEGNTDTTADNKKDEKATEMPNADEKNAEVDNYTVNTEITAGNSIKMRTEPSDEKIDTPTDEKKDEKTAEIPSDNNKEAESQSNDNNAPQASKTSEVGSNTTNIKKIDSTQSQNANKASNAGVLDGLDGETKAMIEELMKRDTAKKVTPMGRDYFKGAPDRWKEIHLKCAYAGGNNGDLLTIEEAIENYSSYESPRLHLDAIRTYAEEICKRMRNVLADNVITQEQFNAFSDVFKFKSEGYKAACAEDFKKNKPTTESEKWMYNWIYKKKNIKN